MADTSEDQAGRPAPAPADPLLPCDACRRRKVKCSKNEPCDRCVSAGLRCTRDIARKKRGPKKGSGSVIAKLRDENHQNSLQDPNLPLFDLSQLQLQMPSLNRALTNDSPLGSPLTSPTSSHFGDTFTPTSDPTTAPRSIPVLPDEVELEPNSHTAFAQAGIQLPASWQMQTSELLQFQAPISPTGYMSVSDLAQQIFPEAPLPVTNMFPARSNTQTPSRTSTPLTKPTSLDAMLTGGAQSGAPSPSATSTSSPIPLHEPKSLYGSDSGNFQSEPRIQSLATELGMSAYLMSQCVRQYFRHLYSIRPMIHETSFLQRLNQNEELSNEEKILILSLCATTVLHAAPQSDLPLDKKLQLGKQFVELCWYLRRSVDWAESTSLMSIQASYHISVALFELKKPRAHHFYLREAIGMAMEQGLHLESTYVGMDETQAICSRRTFALLFITERGLAILRNKPTQITRLPRLSTEYFDEQDGIILAGFSALVNLFSILDEKFVRLWSATSPCEVSQIYETIDNVIAIQHSLNEMSFDRSAMTDIQKADVLITHQWLRLIFWQASMRQGLVSYSSSDPIFSSWYPIDIAKNLCTAMTEISYDAILVHGLGIFEKLFEVAYTLMDALTIANLNWSDSRELRYLFDVLSASPNSQNTYVRMLQTKIESERSPATSPPRVV
ncbi:uncharacterized protein Z518_03840 [Rhinocladiella mackenziei CBS 650.93]|uniref:Rhinocladiella mackenziei CBS 650.93 unplaced genomic scaffold supercont1.3, whole genome shotgun sequence n=1 Tax=Rhinocladiella mackenziei CBS 650.93 TaxID=1442369 RepID=A0A0D2FUV4_9EURO|nr:uncharacterized protein Z518_03840 [Rhinocladiella mackenziei CBS 650.93]KIX05867.1 hypothetical protein Z518_03840 [Rhinocladiella mackenziei CBS 650.93]